MKKIIGVILTATLLFIFVPGVFAGTTSTQETGSVDITITVTATGLKDFTYKASPNVLMNADCSATNYAIESTNNLTDENNGMVYGTLATSSGFAQRAKIASEAYTPASELALDAETWVWMGGS